MSPEEHARHEKTRAQALRKSRWWQSRLASRAHCHYCQTPLTPKTATMDHVVPISQGGMSVPGNVVIACKVCNRAKHDRTAVEWCLEHGELSSASTAELHQIRHEAQE